MTRSGWTPLCIRIWTALWLVGGCPGCASVPTHKGKPVYYPDEVLSGTERPQRFALVVGVDQFTDETWGGLEFAGRDARAMAEVLGEFDEVVLLDRPGRTNRRMVLAELERLVAKAQLERDVIVVYLSTHGTLAYSPVGPLERYIVLEDTLAGQVADTALAVRELLGRLEEARSQRTAAVLAFCHSGEGKSRLNEDLRRELDRLKAPFFVDPLNEVSEATVVLSASAWGETAREDPALGHDVYTYFLLEGIRQGDRNRDGAVTITEAHDYARERTYYHTRGRQRPSSKVQLTGSDPILLAGERRRPGKPEVRAMHPSLEGLDLWVDGQLKGKLPASVAVDPGEHLVQVRRADRKHPLVEALVLLEPDQVVQVLDLLPESPRLAIGAGGGLMTLLGADESLPELMPVVSLRAGVLHWPAEDHGLFLTTYLSWADRRYPQVEVDAHSKLVRLCAGWIWQPPLGNHWSLGLGPEAGVVLVHRGFSSPVDLEPETTLFPSVGLRLTLGRKLIGSLLANLSLSGTYLPVSVDGSIHSSALLEAVLSIELETALAR